MTLPRSISELHERLKNKELTTVSLVDAYLGRISSFNESLNAFNTVTDEYAYTKAKQVDETIANSPNAFNEFPLLGVIVSLKDLYMTKNIRTTASSNVLKDYIPAYSATVVDRLEKAGAIIIGKTNCDAWAHGASGENSDFGPTKNPWNTEYVPGGSSSGSAVSVAADLSLISMGTDTGGSVRQPAGFTGVVGFKPTYGAVPRYGVIAMASSLDSMGHFTHTVDDAERVFSITRGPDGHDSTVKDVESQTASKQKLTIGMPKEYFAEGLDPEVEKVVRDVSAFYESQGHTLVEVSLPHTKYGIAAYYIIQPAEVSSNLGRYDGVRYGNDRSHFGAEAKRRIMLGTYVLSSGYYDAYYHQAMKVRTKMCQDFEKVFSTVDAIIAPVSPTPAFRIGQKSDDPLQMYLADVYTVAANLAGLPAIALPGGFSSNGLPIGFQLVGKQFNEAVLFQLGKEYQSKTTWHTQTPTL